MRIATQLRLVSALSILCLGTTLILSGWQISLLRYDYRAYTQGEQIQLGLAQIEATMLSISRADPILPDTETQLETAGHTVDTLHKQITPALNPELQKLFTETLQQGWTPYLTQFRSAVKIASESPQDALNIPEAIYRTLMEPMLDQLRTLKLKQQDAATSLKARIETRVASLLWVILAPLVIAGLIIVIPQWLVGRKIASQIQTMTRTGSAFAEGDLSVRMPESRNELGELGRSVNQSISALSAMLHTVQEAADQVRDETSVVSRISGEVQNHTEQQSQQLTEMNAAVDTLAHAIATVNELTGKTLAAAATAQNATREAHSHGQESAQDLAATEQQFATLDASTRDLASAFRAIVDVAGSIREVAKQTNLLALNAAIEAARAGEHGRGFAVVADQVRVLSLSTHDATQEIQRILEETEIKTQAMFTALHTAGQSVGECRHEGEALTTALARISKVADEVNQLMSAVAQVMHEQNQASQTISARIRDLGCAASATAADAQSMASETRQLNAVADTLETNMARFTLA